MYEYLIPLTAFGITVCLPISQFSVFYRLIFEKKEVDREDCSCTCWDTFFKGNYELKAGYKHVYFNCTWQTALIWVATLAFFVTFYEILKHALRLLKQNKLRHRMLLIFVFCLYPNFYSWWSYFNNLNDSFYQEFLHQSFFTISEFYITALTVLYLNKETPMSLKKIAIAMVITLMHILSSCFDQFIANVLYFMGEKHQVSRDMGFMMADIGNLIVLAQVYRQMALISSSKLFSREEWLLVLLCVIASVLFLYSF